MPCRHWLLARSLLNHGLNICHNLSFTWRLSLVAFHVSLVEHISCRTDQQAMRCRHMILDHMVTRPVDERKAGFLETATTQR